MAPMEEPNFKRFNNIRSKLYVIVFGTETKIGRLFDIVLLWAILGSILVVILESVQALDNQFEFSKVRDSNALAILQFIS